VVKTINRETLRGGTVYRDFVSLGAPKLGQIDLSESTVMGNPSIHWMTAEIIRVIGFSITEDAYHNRIAKLSRQNIRPAGWQTYSSFSEKAATALSQYFADDVRRVWANHLPSDPLDYLLTNSFAGRPAMPPLPDTVLNKALAWLKQQGVAI